MSSAELFNPATDTFTKLTGAGQSLTEARYGAVAATLPSGQVLIAGGDNASGNCCLSSAELFNPATDTFTKLTGAGQSLTEARCGRGRGDAALRAGPDRGRVPAARRLARRARNCSTPPRTRSRSSRAPASRSPKHASGAVAATLPSGQVLIAGGYGTTGGVTWLASAELFNPATDTFTEAHGRGQSLTEARERGRGDAAVRGGPDRGRRNQQPRRCVERGTLQPSGAGTIPGGEAGAPGPPPYFTKLTGAGQSLTEARQGAVAATLPDGQVLIAGGFNAPSGIPGNISRARNCSTRRLTRSRGSSMMEARLTWHETARWQRYYQVARC